MLVRFKYETKVLMTSGLTSKHLEQTEWLHERNLGLLTSSSYSRKQTMQVIKSSASSIEFSIVEKRFGDELDKQELANLPLNTWHERWRLRTKLDICATCESEVQQVMELFTRKIHEETDCFYFKTKS